MNLTLASLCIVGLTFYDYCLSTFIVIYKTTSILTFCTFNSSFGNVGIVGKTVSVSTFGTCSSINKSITSFTFDTLSSTCVILINVFGTVTYSLTTDIVVKTICIIDTLSAFCCRIINIENVTETITISTSSTSIVF